MSKKSGFAYSNGYTFDLNCNCFPGSTGCVKVLLQFMHFISRCEIKTWRVRQGLGSHTRSLNLTYNHYISKSVSSCFSKLHQINRVRESFDEETLQLLTTSLVFSKILSCSTVWSNTSTQNIEKLQSIQNFASKMM